MADRDKGLTYNKNIFFEYRETWLKKIDWIYVDRKSRICGKHWIFDGSDKIEKMLSKVMSDGIVS